MLDHYILNERHEITVVSFDEWVAWCAPSYESQEGFERLRRVAFTVIDGDCYVSTVFLGIDHGFGILDKPVLFETMVFGGDLDQEMDRYCSWDEADAGHVKMVARVMGTKR